MYVEFGIRVNFPTAWVCFVGLRRVTVQGKARGGAQKEAKTIRRSHLLRCPSGTRVNCPRSFQLRLHPPEALNLGHLFSPKAVDALFSSNVRRIERARLHQRLTWRIRGGRARRCCWRWGGISGNTAIMDISTTMLTCFAPTPCAPERGCQRRKDSYPFQAPEPRTSDASKALRGKTTPGGKLKSSNEHSSLHISGRARSFKISVYARGGVSNGGCQGGKTLFFGIGKQA